MSSIQLGYPVEYVLLCLGAGFIYAFLMYQRSAPWSKLTNRILFGMRWVIVTLLCILLLAPVLRQIRNTTEKPVVLLAVDNSLSIPAVYDSIELTALKDKIQATRRAMEDQGFITEIRNLNGDGSLVFTGQSSNLNAMLQEISNDYEGRNIAEVVMFTDGLFNEGISPQYRDYPFRLSLVGVGDSIPKKDISIENLTYNKIAYEGNKFPMIVTLFQHGFTGENVTISVERQGQTIPTETVNLDKDGQVNIDLLLEADRKGVQRYVISAELKEDEFISENNARDAYIEVIEGKEKICIVAASPHPDLNAFTSVLRTNANYEIEQYILSIEEERQAFQSRNSPTDLYILHQLPSNSYPVNWDEKLRDASVFYMYGPQTNLNGLNTLLPYFSIQAFPGEFDEVSGVFNPSFAPFSYSDELIQSVSQFPPLSTPFGEISADGTAQIMLYQRVGSIETSNPLLITAESGDLKSGLLIGSGLWKWKLADYARNRDNDIFAEFVQKLVQYLSTRADKRRFRLYPVKQEFIRGEEVVFEAEVYNEIYERVYGSQITLNIKDEEGSEQTFSYVTSEASSRYTLSGLNEGVYTYDGTTEIDGERQRVQGEFVVKEQDIETVRLTADFNLLRNVADRNGGAFYRLDESDELLSAINNMEARGVILSEEKYLSAINLTWLFILFVILASLEWGIRKYHGSY